MRTTALALFCFVGVALCGLPALAAPPVIHTHTVRRDFPALRYDVDLQYPQCAGQTGFNRVMARVIRIRLAQYQHYQRQDVLDKVERLGAPTKGYLSIVYSVYFASPTLLSIGFSEETFPAVGAAHPNHQTYSVNYDLAADKPLRLSDVLRGTVALQAVSAYRVARLLETEDADPEWIRRGAGPQMKNYRSWNFSPQGLVINFDRYQVASYAAGPQQVVIPFATLRHTLRPGLTAHYHFTH